jgi:hypothetical protein
MDFKLDSVKLFHQRIVLRRSFNTAALDLLPDSFNSSSQFFNQLNQKSVSAGLYNLFKNLLATGTGFHHF